MNFVDWINSNDGAYYRGQDVDQFELVHNTSEFAGTAFYVSRAPDGVWYVAPASVSVFDEVGLSTNELQAPSAYDINTCYVCQAPPPPTNVA